MKLRISRKNRYSARVELDDVCRGTLPLKVLLPLYPEDFCGEITSGEAGELLKLLEKQACTLLLDYLAKAEHSEFQCRNLLKRRQFSPQIIDCCISRCKEQKYLDDARFAEVLIASYITRRASRRAIIAKLREQRVPTSIWEPLINELYQKNDQKQNLGELMQKYCARHGSLETHKLKEKVFAYLYRKGFELEDIRSAWETMD
jgi:regulatory protein